MYEKIHVNIYTQKSLIGLNNSFFMKKSQNFDIIYYCIIGGLQF